MIYKEVLCSCLLPEYFIFVNISLTTNIEERNTALRLKHCTQIETVRLQEFVFPNLG